MVFVIPYLAFFTGTMAFLSETAQGNASLGAKPPDLVSNYHDFTKDLYNILRTTEGNLFFSPLSLDLALRLVYTGAEGNTASQLKTALRLPESKETLLNHVEEIMSVFKNKKATLKTANALFGQKGYEFRPEYISTAKEKFQAQVKAVNFADDSSRLEINNYVANNTNQKVTELFGPGSIDALTKLVIVNALYFKGSWAAKFSRRDTWKGKFYLNENETVQTDFMNNVGRYKIDFNKEINATIISVPYEDEEVSMIIVLPNEINGLQRIEEQIHNLDLAKLTWETRSHRAQSVVLNLPKFKLKQTIQLNSILQQLGIKDLFDPKLADLSGLTQTKDLFCSKALQMSFIEVNEEGTEAAAATGALLVPASTWIKKSLSISVDRPFLFFLSHSTVQLPLFVGRLCKF